MIIDFTTINIIINLFYFLLSWEYNFLNKFQGEIKKHRKCSLSLEVINGMIYISTLDIYNVRCMTYDLEGRLNKL
jgi:hypothetical protein